MRIRQTPQFKRDLKRLQKKHYDLLKLREVVALISKDAYEMFVSRYRYRLHRLKGKWKGHYELHIEGDWLLIYLREDGSCTLVRMGSHDEFK